MPEGDSVHEIAARFRATIEGRRLEGLSPATPVSALDRATLAVAAR